MKNIIVGTAGHIDHGKTSLIRALTGKETDRWEEEKRRGITIDLGFAYFDLPNGNRIGIIDVPGHEKFIKNMLAGVIGMDLVLLVIAADEGIMPQTQEHINILNMLGIKKGIVVLTKCDLTDEDWIELVKEDIKEELENTFFKDAEIIEVSSVTGSGLDVLTSAIERITSEELEERDIYTIPRLPIDRAFTISGFGTVITGTLISGQIKKGDELEIYPINQVCKIRNIQVHGHDTDNCYAGQRTAINLSNVKKSQLYRGCVIAPMNSMKNTMMLDVKINLLKSSKRMVENRSRLHLYTGTSEVLCRIVLFEKDVLSPGESCYAQLRLEEEIAVRRGDKFILRFYSPMETIGGGVIVEPVAIKKANSDDVFIENLKIKEQGSKVDVIESKVKENSYLIPSITELAKITALSKDEIDENLIELEKEGKISIFRLNNDSFIWHKSYEDEMSAKIFSVIENFHVENRYKHGIKKSEVKSRFLPKLKQNVFDSVLSIIIKNSKLKLEGEFLSLNEFTISEDEKYKISREKIDKKVKSSGYNFVKIAEILELDKDAKNLEDILNLMIESGDIIKFEDDVFTYKKLVDDAKHELLQYLNQKNKISAAEFRDMLDANRKSAILLLEYFDALKITKRVENDRVLF